MQHKVESAVRFYRTKLSAVTESPQINLPSKHALAQMFTPTNLPAVTQVVPARSSLMKVEITRAVQETSDN